MNDMTHRAPVDLPQLRTLLLTDLCDSTELVERLGDVSAAALFREHDRLVLELQQRWRGRLIDRSDGLLLLFERPIDGLGFALDYVRGLRTLGEKRSVELKARAGLHVGEVLTWRNSTEAVQVGAKPLEVEGLAKPMAARLMAVARPGQILLSAVAEPLAHRAARELGERGQHLLWKSHGRWRFKGVPDSQQIYEVGEPGIAPLRMPPNSPKAWRDIPLWRRPAALAAEVALIGVIGVGVWFATRPAPAIAFNQRDWVVVADLRNLTGQAVLDDSLEQAFRISLEQSRYVNVLSDMKARDTLARMQLKPGTVLDRAVASEIALRDGARAVILPTVAEVGGKVRVSAEVIDPHSQSTVFAVSADGAGRESTLTSVDVVVASMREKLGEAVASIKRDSEPLPQVSTGNLEALRAYALGQRAHAENRFQDALVLFTQATELDPKFALAWIGQARSQFALWDIGEGMPALRKAEEFKTRLVPRESLYLEGWMAEFDQPAKALEKWKLMASMYPDYAPAQANAAIRLLSENRYEEASQFATRATASQYDLIGNSFDQLGRAQLGQEKYKEASSAFDQALAAGNRNSLRRRASAAAASGDLAGAQAFLNKAPPSDVVVALDRVSVAVDGGRWAAVQKMTGQDVQARDAPGQYQRAFELSRAVVQWLMGNSSEAVEVAQRVARQSLQAAVDGPPAQVPDELGTALNAAILAQRAGDRALAKQVMAQVSKVPDCCNLPYLKELVSVLKADDLRLSGRPEAAIAELEPYLGGHERFQTRVALMEAYAAAGNLDQAAKQAEWLSRRRGLAYLEQGCAQCQQTLNVADTRLVKLRMAELLFKAGKNREALASLDSFDSAWPVQSLPGYLRDRRSLLNAASN